MVKSRYDTVITNQSCNFPALYYLIYLDISYSTTTPERGQEREACIWGRRGEQGSGGDVGEWKQANLLGKEG